MIKIIISVFFVSVKLSSYKLKIIYTLSKEVMCCEYKRKGFRCNIPAGLWTL